MTANYLDAIRKFEGFTPKADWDYAQFTNGYGTKAKYAGEVIDKVEADRRFQAEIAQARAIVDKHAPHVDEGTKAALTSLTFNAGDKWARSGLGEAIRSGDTERVRDLFLQYNKAGGEVLPGLAQRRIAEAAWIGQDSAGSSFLPLPPPVMASAAAAQPPPGASFLGGRSSAPAARMVSSPMTLASLEARAPAAMPEPTDFPAQPTDAAQVPAKSQAEIEDELLAKIRGAVSGFGSEARMTQLLLASKLIGGPSTADPKAGDKSGLG